MKQSAKDLRSVEEITQTILEAVADYLERKMPENAYVATDDLIEDLSVSHAIQDRFRSHAIHKIISNLRSKDSK